MSENLILKALLNFFQTLAAQIKLLIEFYLLPSPFCIILLGQDTKFKASSQFHKYSSRLCRDTDYSKHNSCMLHRHWVSQENLSTLFGNSFCSTRMLIDQEAPISKAALLQFIFTVYHTVVLCRMNVLWKRCTQHWSRRVWTEKAILK